MTEAVAVQHKDQSGPGLDDFIQEWEDDQAEAEAEANKVSPEDKEKVRAMAAKMDDGFLWLVTRTQCPHVQLDQMVDREKGREAFMPLAEKFGGEVPPWMIQFEPYIAAGMYMGGVIMTARKAEAQALAQIEAQKGAGDGEKRESRPEE